MLSLFPAFVLGAVWATGQCVAHGKRSKWPCAFSQLKYSNVWEDIRFYADPYGVFPKGGKSRLERLALLQYLSARY